MTHLAHQDRQVRHDPFVKHFTAQLEPSINGQIPQRPRRLDHHLVHTIAQSLNQLADDILALKHAPSRGVVLDQVAHGCTGPCPIGILG
jgi:hypothetical protein